MYGIPIEETQYFQKEAEIAEIEETLARNALYEKLTAQAKTEVCAVCEGPLVVAWRNGGYVLSCGQDRRHEGTKSCWETKKQLERKAKERW